MPRQAGLLLIALASCGLLVAAAAAQAVVAECTIGPGASCPSADLSAADLSGAKLSGAKLFGAELSGAVWIDGSRCIPGSVGACRFAQAAVDDDAAPKPDKRGPDRKRGAEIPN